MVEALEPTHQLYLKALAGYLDQHITPEFVEAEALFAKGVVSRKHWAKLFCLDEIVVTVEHGQAVAFVSVICPIPNDDFLVLYCWSWAFDGKFFRREAELRIPWPSKNDVTAITDLQVYPLKYAKAGLEDKLRNRGERFWGCRGRKYVSYDVPLSGMEIQIVRHHFSGSSQYVH